MLKKTFYILAEIPKQDIKIELKDGFKIQGDIITGEMKLYRYVFRNLFGNV